MGGYGSGRPGWRPVAEQSLALYISVFFDAIEMIKGRPDWRGASVKHSLVWRRPYLDQEIASIGYELLGRSGQPIAVTLSYTYRGQPVQDTIKISSTACHFGGWRYWFVCPTCGQRRRVLFAPGTYWRCGPCVGITYESSNESHRFDHVFRELGADRTIQKILMPKRQPLGPRSKRKHRARTKVEQK